MVIYDALTLLVSCLERDQQLSQPSTALISRLIVSHGIYCILSPGVLCGEEDSVATSQTDREAKQLIRDKAISCLLSLSPEHVLTCTHSPWKTPQNLPDPYLRTLRNEPSNIAAVVGAVVECWIAAGRCSTPSEGSAILFENAKRVFSIIDGQHSEAQSDCAPIEVLQGKGSVDGTNTKNIEPLCAVATPVTSSLLSYRCKTCRKFLFDQSHILSHSDGIATGKEGNVVGRSNVFRVGDEGLCSSSIFLSMSCGDATSDSRSDGTDESEGCQASAGGGSGSGVKGRHRGMKGSNKQQPGSAGKQQQKHAMEEVSGFRVVRDDVINCSGCGSKLGKYCVGSATCSCGAVVSGPVLRFTSLRLDVDVRVIGTVKGGGDDVYGDNVGHSEEVLSLALSQAQLHARMESGLRDEIGSDDEGGDSGTTPLGKAKRKKKIKIVSKNKGDYSVFRDKVSSCLKIGKGPNGFIVTVGRAWYCRRL